MLSLNCSPVAASQQSTLATTTLHSLVIDTPNSGLTEQYNSTSVATTAKNISNLNFDKSILNPQQPSTQRLPKSYKFTLTAGKLWRFTFTTKSYPTTKGTELRLHKNLSINNYLIDDDGWFQYDHQLQQLYAWPSLEVRPGTYHYVLLPSGLDLEAEGENTINSEVVANIVVELIRPIYGATKSDIEQLIDHKFSLNFLHRQGAYTLLLHQVVAVFNSLSKPGSAARNDSFLKLQDILPTTTINPSSPPTISSIVPSNVQNQKNWRPSDKLNEYLLLSSTYSSDGEYFSLTWTTNTSPKSNTISLLNDCRFSIINETVSRFSFNPPNIEDSEDDDKYTISIKIDPSRLNSQAIIPTKRGNFALKLTLKGPCRRDKIIESLGSISSARLPKLQSEKLTEFSKDSSTTSPDTIFNRTNNNLSPASYTRLPGLPVPEAIDSTTATHTHTINTLQSRSISNSSDIIISSSTTESPKTTTSYLISASSPTVLPKQADSKPEINRRSDDKNSSSTSSTIMAHPTSNETYTKQAPQAKSFASYLDLNESISNTNATIMSPDSTISTSNQTQDTHPVQVVPYIEATTSSTPYDDGALIESNAPKLPDILRSNISSIPLNSQDRGLTDDFLDVLSDIMDHLIAVAVPVSVVIGAVLLISIIIALCNLRHKKKKARQFGVNDRFSFRYNSERRAFLKSSSKPVILEADQKSISLCGTPVRKVNPMTPTRQGDKQSSKTEKNDIVYLAMQPIASPKR